MGKRDKDWGRDSEGSVAVPNIAPWLCDARDERGRSNSVVEEEYPKLAVTRKWGGKGTWDIGMACVNGVSVVIEWIGEERSF